jgi:hypothetical protein
MIGQKQTIKAAKRFRMQAKMKPTLAIPPVAWARCTVGSAESGMVMLQYIKMDAWWIYPKH